MNANSRLAHHEEARRANRAVKLELIAIVLFLTGLFLVVVAIAFSAGPVVEQIAPSQAMFVPERMVLPKTLFTSWTAVLGILPLVLPAVILMSAGMVLRRFIDE